MHQFSVEEAVPAREHGPPALSIDLGTLFRAKNPRLAQKIPAPVMRALELLIHQRELRQFVLATRDCSACEFTERALSFLNVTVESVGEEHLPGEPQLVFCANHPTGGVDGLAMMHLLCRRYGGLRVPANDLLQALPSLDEFLTPVDKHGSNWGRAASYSVMYEAPVPVLVFPAGRTGRLRAGALREYPWDKAFVKYARRGGRTIVPVHISGRNSAHFYAIWRIRRALKIGMNLEMLLLVDELFRQRGNTVRVSFGTPVDPGPATGPPGDRAIADRLRRQVERGLPVSTG